MKNIDEVLDKKGYVLFTVSGVSMLPLLVENKSTVKVEKKSSYKIDDVILFRHEANLVLHRIIDINNEQIITRGDNSINKELINIGDIIGVMVGYYNQDKYIPVTDSQYLDYVSNYVHPNINNDFRFSKSNYLIKCAIREIFRYGVISMYDKTTFLKLNEEELDAIFEISFKLKINHLFYAICNELKLAINDKKKELLLKYYELSKRNNVVLDNAKNEISLLLSKNEIKHLYLKWGEISRLYNSNFIRQAADLDIYVNVNSLDKCISILSSELSFHIVSEDDVHVSLISEKLNVQVELHFKLLENNYKNIDIIIPNPFDVSYEDSTTKHLYHMNKESYYLYNLGHFAKHLRYFGFRFAHIYDLYQLQNDKSISNKTVESLLNRSELELFNMYSKEIINLYIFGFTNYLDIYKLEDYLYCSISSSSAINNKKVYKNKFSYIMHKIILPYKEICNYAPKAEQHKILVPYYQIKRWFDRLVHGRIKNVKSDLSHYSKIDVNNVNNILNKIGL